MTPQELKEQLLKMEAYAQGFRDGGTTAIKWMAEQLAAAGTLSADSNGSEPKGD